MWLRRRLLLTCLASALACGAALTAEQEEAAANAKAEEENEAHAQKALTDALTDALAMLKHGSASAKASAAASIANLAIETTISQPFHPITFRNACVRAGIVDELVKLLAGGEKVPGVAATLAALEAIATDDPSTELDNGHALEVCKAGAVAPVVALLRSTDEALQVGAAGCVAVLAENPQCQTALLDDGAIEPLVLIGTYGGDSAKLRAVSALDLLALNNPEALERIGAAGGVKLLDGLKRYGGGVFGEATSELRRGMEAPPEARTVAVDAKAHARQAHSARLRHSKVWSAAAGGNRGAIRRAVAPAGAEEAAGEDEGRDGED